jgi:pyridoxal phosphate enzyme (YggS family)
VQTLASEKIARRLSEQRPEHLPPLNVLIQVNVSGEASKNGVAPKDVAALARMVSLMPRLRLRGLMAMPEPGADRSRYREAKEIFALLRAEIAVDTLSMGMSDDLELAIAEGATMVRVGTAIFGQRKKEKSAA